MSTGASVERGPASGAAPAGAGRVLGTFLVLAGLVAGLFWVARGLFVGSVDGAAKQREYFGEGAPPFGLALESAVRLPGGDVLVRFTRATDAELARAPADAVFLELASRSAAEALLRAGEEGPDAAQRLKEWQKDPSFDLQATLKRDDISWGEWSSKLLIRRSFAKGGGWRDEARVNLSSGARALVLLAHWPSEVAADEKSLHELLLAVVLAPPGA